MGVLEPDSRCSLWIHRRMDTDDRFLFAGRFAHSAISFWSAVVGLETATYPSSGCHDISYKECRPSIILPYRPSRTVEMIPSRDAIAAILDTPKRHAQALSHRLLDSIFEASCSKPVTSP